MQVPPLHPILVNFTAALIPVSVVSDWLGRLLRRESFHTAAWWMLLYATVVTPLTALAGWWWMRQMGDMDHWQMVWHMWLGFSIATATVALAIWRYRAYRRGLAPGLAYLLFATVAVAALVVQGDLGGQMSFGGASPEASAPATPAAEHQHHADLQWRDHVDLKQGS